MPSFNLQRLSNLLLFVLYLITWGCSSKSDKNGDTISDTNSAAAMTEDDKLEAILNEAMKRLRYKDKSYIYEMEFSYYREENTFDKYLQETKIKTAQADSLEFVDVIKVEYFGQDSAKAIAEIHFKGPTGQETTLPDQEVTFYWDQDRWIKPTLSKIESQRKYDEIKEKAKSAAKSESGGSGK